LLERCKNFDISIVQRGRGVKLDIKGAPALAFVNGVMIKGIQEHLFAVLRDICS
jgi:predicted YcjX-like family ATPase